MVRKELSEYYLVGTWNAYQHRPISQSLLTHKTMITEKLKVA